MVLLLDDKAQWEIQKLLESRDKASSTHKVKREWEIVAFQTRPRRKISVPVKKKWWKKGEKPLVEWVMVIRGETIDHQRREMPAKHENPWGKTDGEKAGTNVKTNTPAKLGKKTLKPAEEEQEKTDGVVVSLAKPAASMSVYEKGKILDYWE